MAKDNFLDIVLDALEDLGTLEIKTVIGTCIEENGKQKPNLAGAQMMYSKIGLIDGDITTVIDESFLEEARASIKDYHLEREKAGREIIRTNIQALQSLVGLFVSLTERKKEQEKESGNPGADGGAG